MRRAAITIQGKTDDRASASLHPAPYADRVMVMPNLYGAIVSNIGAALVGGPGIVPGCNVGRVSIMTYRRFSLLISSRNTHSSNLDAVMLPVTSWELTERTQLR